MDQTKKQQLQYVSLKMDDPRFRITTYQQMASAVTGALITSLTSKYNIKKFLLYYIAKYQIIAIIMRIA